MPTTRLSVSLVATGLKPRDGSTKRRSLNHPRSRGVAGPSALLVFSEGRLKPLRRNESVH